MKKLYLLLTVTFLTISISYGQFCGDGSPAVVFNFDNGITPPNYWLWIDTVSNPNNIWQIGSPQKSIISSAYSAPKVIITDTVNFYPSNDTSVFIIGHLAQIGAPGTLELSGYYNVNSDSLNDFGSIEISFNQGATWINLITDTIYNLYYYWNGPKPTLTGNSNGWQFYGVSLSPLQSFFNVQWGDTILFRFTFISDSIANAFDGLAFDNFMFCDYIEGIEEIPNDNLISIYPNPTSNLLFINRSRQPSSETIEVYNHIGELVFEDRNFKSKTIDTKKLNLTDGFYYLKYSDTKNYSVKKFIVEHN
jgi:hypothetical protein